MRLQSIEQSTPYKYNHSIIVCAEMLQILADCVENSRFAQNNRKI